MIINEKVNNKLIIRTILAASLLYVFYYISQNNYLLFHSITEIFSIVVAIGIFVIAWNLRERITNNYLLFIGYAYLFIAFIDLLHTLAFKGMGVFESENTSNQATQLWIAARYLESISLLLASFLINKKYNSQIILFSYSFFVFLVIGSIFFWNIFPDCYIEPAGLTAFKIISEYIISIILLLSLLSLWKKKAHFEKSILKLIFAAIVFTILSEFIFTTYKLVDDQMNFIGHILKIISFYFIYLSLISISLRRPFELIFRELHNKNIKCVEDTNFMNAVLDTADVLVVVLDRKGMILLFNKSCEKLTGYSYEEIYNIPFWDLFIKDDELDDVKTVFNNLKKGDYPNTHENYWIMKDGTLRLISWSNTVLLDSRNNIQYIVGTGIDITKRKELERENKNIINMIAHDLKSPLISIQLLADHIIRKKNKLNNSDIHRYISYIHKEGERLNSLVDEFVEYTLLQNDVLKINYEPIIPGDILSEICGIYKIIAIKKGISMNCDCSLDQLEILGDEKRLKRVFTNLLDNAIKFTGKNGKIDIMAVIDGGYLKINISDNGIGISEKDLPYIFYPYHKGIDADKYNGYGLGLSYVKSVIEKHNGKIKVKSIYGTGTEFTIMLPAYIKTNEEK